MMPHAIAAVRSWAQQRCGRSVAALSLLLAVLAMRPASAGPEVLYQGPDSRLIEDLFGAPAGGPGQGGAPPPAATVPAHGITLPLQPQRLTVGQEPARPLPEAAGRPRPRLPRPLFLIGADPVSLRWLAVHADALAAIGAVGLIVQAATAADIAHLRGIAPSVPMLAVPGDDLAAQLGIRHYPVVIGPDDLRSVP